jgi:transposase
MRGGRPPTEPTLTSEEQATLSGWTRRPMTAQAHALRARVILGAAEARSNKDVAAALAITELTVGKWRRRFLARRLDGLLDVPCPGAPRPGAPPTIGDADVERVIARTLESAPRDATHWSTRPMAATTDYSQSTISRIWRAFALAPQRSETFKLSSDPLFIEKVRDIVGLYLGPPERAIVFSVDEKTQIQALDRTAPMLPLRPGQVERHTHGYAQHGTTSLFRRSRGRVRPGDRRVSPAPPLGRVPHLPRHGRDERAAGARDPVILDNYGTHKTALIHLWLAKHPRYHLHRGGDHRDRGRAAARGRLLLGPRQPPRLDPR